MAGARPRGKPNSDESNGKYSPRLPLIRQHSIPCDFQKSPPPLRRRKSRLETKSEPPWNTGSLCNPKTSLADKLPEIMAKFKAQLGAKGFIMKTRQSIEMHKRVERPWVKGSDISPFYHVWQTSEDHLKGQKVRDRTARRSHSMPRNYKFSDIHSGKALEPDISRDFGILRECCSKPKIRIKTFSDR